MDEFNKSKAFELAEKAEKEEDNGRFTQEIFGVEINVDDNDLNGIIEKNKPSTRGLDKIALHLEDLELGC